MNRITFRAVKVGVVVSAAAGIAALTSSGGHAILLDVYLLCIGGVLLLALVRTTRARAPVDRRSSFDAAVAEMRRVPADSGAPAMLRDLQLARASAFHLHVRVRPVLREIAAHRLRTRYGVELDREPARARELVGASVWEVVRPDCSPPADRLALGPSTAELQAVVDDLEAV
jgi:hypothetical protein